MNGAELKEDFKERLSERHVQNVTGHQKERVREVERGLEEKRGGCSRRGKEVEI